MLHGIRTAETHGVSSQSVPGEAFSPSATTSTREQARTYINSTPKKSNTMYRTSTGRRSSGSVEAGTRGMSTRPSALPRSTSSSSQARLSYIASTRPMPTFAGKSPPLQALKLASTTTDLSRLDTSQMSLASDTSYGRYDRTMSPIDMDEDTVLGVALPGKPSTYPPANLPPRLIPELQALAASNPRQFNPASSSISSISSPSTQFTTSSSPWSASTAATTPISWSSASPSVAQAIQAPGKRSLTHPMLSGLKSKSPKLPVLKESLLSAKSSKTTLATEAERSGRRMKKAHNIDPTPPPRSSSIKRNRSRNISVTTSTTEKEPALVYDDNRFPVPPIGYSASVVAADGDQQPLTGGERADWHLGHSRLQSAINKEPHHAKVQSSRQMTHAVEQPEIGQPQPRQLLEPLPVVKSQHRRFPSLSRRHARQPSSSEPELEKPSARSRLAKFSGLSIFNRSKNSVREENKPAHKMQSRKGPAAGTGHEAYGRFGRRGRKQSTGSSAGATDSETSIVSVSRRPAEKRRSRTSTTSQDQSDLDDFTSSRMKPMVLVGGSQRGKTHPFPPVPTNAQLSDLSVNTVSTAVSSAESYRVQPRMISPRRERFLPNDEEVRPTLATRRSQKFAPVDEPFRFPVPIDTQNLIATPCLDSRETAQSSDVPTPASAMYRLDPSLLEKQKSKSKKMKWNIFRRKESISETDEAYQRPKVRPGMVVNVAPGPSSRAIPYYAMIDSETEVDTSAAIGQFLREAQESPEKEGDLATPGLSDDEVTDNAQIYRHSLLLPSAPIRRQKQPSTPPEAVQENSYHAISTPVAPPTAEQSDASQRQPRLAHVGRIPKVVPTSTLAQPGVEATERPRAATRPRANEMVNVRPSREQLPRLDTGKPPVTQRQELSSRRLKNDRALTGRRTQPTSTEQEFLQFPQVRNSDLTTSSESTGIISIMGPPTSDIPFIARPDGYFAPHEDEVWNEYDDFMDDIMSPSQSTKSPRKQKKSDKISRVADKKGTGLGETSGASGLAILTSALHTTGPPMPLLEAPMHPLLKVPSLQEMASAEEIRLRRSRIAAALHASYAPSSPFSMRDFLDEYGRPNSGKFSERLSGSSAKASTPTQALAPPVREPSRTRQYENAAQLEDIERIRNPTKHSDRAYASLMVSRWLSFGRVLFSPAHQEIEANPERHVLVIDGLGSEDWSIYCAVTYQQERAYVHDLKERRHGRSKAKTIPSSENAPPNHRRSEVSSFNDKFPFPPGFFSAIVVRFPPAMPDSKLKNIVSECRRVLSPGGYLELMVLDLDMVNMGVQARRAIKDLKIKMTAADRAVSLKPIIDNVQTVLGSNGFSNVSRCVVGVPVVGKPVGSIDSSSESRSSTEARRSSAGPRPYDSLGDQANFSLNDLVADHSENADAKIGKMVSRTARSWWQHCFEAGMMANGNMSKSVFANKEVLKECKARGASFKLLIAYTQKPLMDAKRRTVSEPMVPTLAIAGSGRTVK